MNIKHWFLRLLLKLYVFFCVVRLSKMSKKLDNKATNDITNEYKDL